MSNAHQSSQSSVLLSENILRALLYTTIFLIPVHEDFWVTFGLNFPLEPAEISGFILISLTLILRWKAWTIDKFTAIASAWLLINFASAAYNGLNRPLIGELIKIIYLICLFMAMRSCLKIVKPINVLNCFVLSVAASGIIGAIGIIMLLTGHPSTLVLVLPAYPYVGAMAKASAFTASPNMLASMCMLACVFNAFLLVSRPKNLSLAVLATTMTILLISVVLAISKTLICIIGILLIILSVLPYNIVQTFKIPLRISGAMCFVLFILVAHFVIGSAHGEKFAASRDAGYIEDGDTFAGIYCAPTVYVSIKRGLLSVISENNAFGIGPGQFFEQHAILQSKGIYSDKLEPFEPHSTPLGCLAELGVSSCAFFIIALAIIIRGLRDKVLSSESGLNKTFGIFLLILLAGIITESLVTDIMKFRHYWLLYALIAHFTNAEGSLFKNINSSS